MLKNTYINFEFFDDWSDHDKSKCMQIYIYIVFKFKINKNIFRTQRDNLYIGFNLIIIIVLVVVWVKD